MKYADLIQKSRLCESCNGSGQIMSCLPPCIKCQGYGTILEAINPIKKKLSEMIVETMSMSDLSYIIHGIRALQYAECMVDEQNYTIRIRFALDREYGSIWLKPRKDGSDLHQKFVKKVTAAATAMMAGNRPKTFKDIENVLNGKISSQAIKILTNPREWEVTGLRWADFKFGNGLN